MKVKDLVLKLDNSGTKFKFYTGKDNSLIVSTHIDKMKKDYKEGKGEELFKMNIKKWVIEGMGESISVYLK